MFSVTTIPSSTTSPVASTIPKSVKTFIEKPNKYIIKNTDNPISIIVRNTVKTVIFFSIFSFLKNINPVSIIKLKKHRKGTANIKKNGNLK